MRREARGARREGMRREGGEARGDEARGARGEARGVEGCTLHVEGGTTAWRDAPTCAPALACAPAPGDSARPQGFGERGEARGLKVERCTLNVGRQRGGMHRHVRPHWRV